MCKGKKLAEIEACDSPVFRFDVADFSADRLKVVCGKRAAPNALESLESENNDENAKRRKVEIELATNAKILKMQQHHQKEVDNYHSQIQELNEKLAASSAAYDERLRKMNETHEGAANAETEALRSKISSLEDAVESKEALLTKAHADIEALRGEFEEAKSKWAAKDEARQRNDHEAQGKMLQLEGTVATLKGSLLPLGTSGGHSTQKLRQCDL